MKRILFYLWILLPAGLSAQTPVIPSHLPVKPATGVVPPKSMRVYAPADLVISQAVLRSITRNDLHGAYEVTLSVTVRNNGEQWSSGISKIKAFVAPAGGFYKVPTPYPLGANDPGNRIPYPWTYVSYEPGTGRIDGGNYWTGDLTFEVNYFGGQHDHDKFYMVLLADYYNNTVESNEHNNYSAPLFITPPR